MDKDTERCLSILREIEAGRRTFAPRAQNEADLAEFQIIVRDLDWLYRRGYLQLFKPLRESESGRRQFVIAQVGDLTFEGSAAIKQHSLVAQASVAVNTPDNSGNQETNMLVFISWSGSSSHQIALALKGWLPAVLPFADPWVSSEDIAKGSRWTTDMAAALKKAAFGIICVVPENMREPWIIFEAGAISNQLSTRVSPFLLGLSPRDLGNNPLSQFQCTSYEKDDIKKMIHSLNEAHSSAQMTEKQIERTFEACWPGLQQKLDPIKARTSVALDPANTDRIAPQREQAQRLEEIKEKILVLIAQNEQLHDAQVAQLAGISKPLATLHLHDLRDAMLIDSKFGLIDNAWEADFWFIEQPGRKYLLHRGML